MNTIDLSPLYRSSVGFDRFGSILDAALRGNQPSPGYPPYNIEIVDENEYAVTLAVAGFADNELDIQVENGVLTVRGEKAEPDKDVQYLHQGIAFRTFERKFNLADHVEVRSARLTNGLLHISLVREVPEAMKPKRINIDTRASADSLEHKQGTQQAA